MSAYPLSQTEPVVIEPTQVSQLRGILLAWAMAVLMPLAAIGGFVAATDASGWFRLNAFGTYGGDELFIKSSLLRFRDHQVLILGDSRAAFSLSPKVDGLSVFNAASGGATLGDARALLDDAVLDRVQLVVLMVPVGDAAAGCPVAPSRLNDSANWLREGLTFDALGAATAHLRYRLANRVPDHRPDGVRYPDNRVAVAPEVAGGRGPDYRETLEEVARERPMEIGLAEDTPCADILHDMADGVSAAGGEFLLVFAPINRDLLDASGSNPQAVQRIIAENIQPPLPVSVDLTVSEFSDPANFPANDPVHFYPKIGRAVLQTAIDRYCAEEGRCRWRD